MGCMRAHEKCLEMRWGPLFGARAKVWADTWEGPQGWGTSVYDYVVQRARVGQGTSVLDCGCGAGRFVQIAIQRGAQVAGIDASRELIAIAIERSPRADLRVGNFETLPWPDRFFDVVTGFSTFQFAENHVQALAEARRVAKGRVWLAVPTRLADSGLPAVFANLMELFPPDVLDTFKRSGMFALSAPGKLEEALTMAKMSVLSDDTIEAPVVFHDAAAAVDAFLSAGATTLAIQQSGEPAVEKALYGALGPFAGELGRLTLPGWFRVVEAG
jgi:SAM-dependent methyltransferase